MLRLLLNLLIAFFAWRLIRPLFTRSQGSQKKREPLRPRPGDKPLSDLTPYEIEDADYEEIRPRSEG